MQLHTTTNIHYKHEIKLTYSFQIRTFILRIINSYSNSVTINMRYQHLQESFKMTKKNPNLIFRFFIDKDQLMTQ